MQKTFSLIFLCLIFSSCKQKGRTVRLLDPDNFTTLIREKPVSLYTLESGKGLYMQVTNWGGRVVSLWTPDRNGNYDDIVLGYENIDRYVNNAGERFLGAIVGRYANRIANGQFILEMDTFLLPRNDNGQTLHGGTNGLDCVVWDIEKISKNEIVFSYISPDGEEGFPGTVKIFMCYTLTPDNEFKITYRATTDKPTIINLSHHSFFNLKGEGNGTITDHLLTIHADSITLINEDLIPTGEIMPVEGTPFDFRSPVLIGERIGLNDQQLKNGAGYDHNWVIKTVYTEEIKHIASVYEPVSGRTIDIWSDQPGIQFYSGNFFNGEYTGKNGRPLKFRESFALETQKFPDSPNHPQFPSTRLNPNETYTQTCIYKFNIKQ